MSDFWARMRLEILRSNGVEYQRLFETVMELSYPEKFRKVKPWGRKGDGGNDGYIPERGEYYQVYAPREHQISHNQVPMGFLSNFYLNGLRSHL